jgi:hypothetical protein
MTPVLIGIYMALSWVLFFSSLATVLIYGIRTPWRTHPVGRGFFWTAVAWSFAILVTNLSIILPLSLVIWLGMIGYAFLIIALWKGINLQILREQKLKRSGTRPDTTRKEASNG